MSSDSGESETEAALPTEEETFAAYLAKPLGLSQELITALKRQGITHWQNFENLDADDVKAMCVSLKKPGGEIPNPRANMRGQPPMIANPGVLIPIIIEKRLQQFRYFVHHMLRTQRQVILAHATLAHLTDVHKMEKEDENSTAPTLPKKIEKVDTVGVRNAMEDLDTYLAIKRGATGVPLAYVTRESSQLPSKDLGYGRPTPVEEMIRRAPHSGNDYLADNRDVWEVINHVAHGGPAWGWVSDYSRSKDGRKAYKSLRKHYLGRSYKKRIAAVAEGKINASWWDGKSRTFTLEQYCANLKGYFTDLSESGETVDETRKIRILLNGITAPEMEVAVKNVIGREDDFDDFEDVVDYLLTTQDQTRARGRTQSARAVGTVGSNRNGDGSGRGSGHGRGGRGGRGNRDGKRGRGGNGRGGRGGHGGPNPAPYIPYHKWKDMSQEERDAHRKKHEKHQLETLNRTIKALNRRNGYDNSSETTSITTTSSSPQITEISRSDVNDRSVGAVMSQRANRNQN
jgi:hypothetical protein